MSRYDLRALTRLELEELRQVQRCLEVLFLVLNAPKHEKVLRASLVSKPSIKVPWEDVLQLLTKWQMLLPLMANMDETVEALLASPLLRAYISRSYFEGPEALELSRVQRCSNAAAALLRWFVACQEKVEVAEEAKKGSEASEAAAERERLAAEEREREREALARAQAEKDASAERARQAAEAAAKEKAAQAKAEADKAAREREEELARQAAAAVRQAVPKPSAPKPPLKVPEAKAETAEVAVPPPGVPPTKKITTKGALQALPPKGQVAEPQQTLLSALAAPAAPKVVKSKTGPCDKCDDPHHADDCPHYPNAREVHKDAWQHYGKKGAASEDAAPFVLRGATVVQQPGDGSCMFHSLAYGLGGGCGAGALRKDIARYVSDHPDTLIGGTPIKDWVLWDSGLCVKDYAARMGTGNHWGGAIELAVCVLAKGCKVHVYEAKGGREFERISTFGEDTKAPTAEVHVVYGGRVHYDALRVPP